MGFTVKLGPILEAQLNVNYEDESDIKDDVFLNCGALT